MAKSNICYHNVRLNLDNEQHRRVHRILAELNTDIHKSVNQFIVNAVDSHISSLSDENLVRGDEERKKAAGYVTRDELDGMWAGLKSEVKNEVKNEAHGEIILLLATALGGGTARAAGMAAGRAGMDAAAVKADGGAEEPDDPAMMELVDRWG